MLPGGHQGAEDGRAEQHAGQQLPHDRRLAQALHNFAKQSADKDQEEQLGEENCRAMACVHVPPCKSSDRWDDVRPGREPGARVRVRTDLPSFAITMLTMRQAGGCIR